MRRRAGPERPIGQFIGIGLRRRDQVRDRSKRRFGIDHDDVEGARDQRDGHEILMRIVRQLGVGAGIDRICERPHQQRVAIGLAGCDRLGPDDGPRPRLVLDDDGGAEILCHLLRQRPRNHIGTAARRKGNDDPDDLVGKESQGTISRKHR